MDHQLPTGYRLTSVLAARPGLRVVRATGPAGEDAVLRLEDGSADEVAHELAVLAAVDHPGLARVLDFGPLSGGGSFVARSHVDGRPLDGWDGVGDPARVGRAAFEIAGALAHLHGAGFVHGDLKPSNVVVRPDGTCVVVDYGLSDRSGSGRPTGGTLVAVAPERLAGAPLEPAADLFALGALMVEALVGRPDPARFYAEFPRRPFLEAAGIEPERLPEWSRDLVVRLVARDPRERPESAQSVARELAARLGLAVADAASPEATASRLAPPSDLGREDVVRQVVEVLLQGAAGTPGRRSIAVGHPRDVEPLARRIRLAAALAGVAAEDEGLRSDACERDAADLDRWARERARAGTAPLVIRVATYDAWDLRRARTLARAANQAGRSAVVVAFANDPSPAHGAAPTVAETPSATPATHADEEVGALDARGPRAGALRAFLARRLEEHDGAADDAALDRLVRELVDRADGSLERVRDGLLELARAGAFVDTGRALALRPGPLPTSGALGAPTPFDREEMSTADRELLAATAAAGEATSRRVAALTQRSERDVSRALFDLEARGAVERLGRDRYRSRVPLVDLFAEGGADAARALLERGACEPALVLDTLLDASLVESTTGALLERIDAGEPELALAWLDTFERWSDLLDPLGAHRRAALGALAWLGLNQLERAATALALAEDTRSTGVEPRGEALLERARGRLAQRRQDPERALEHFARAAEIDPQGRAEAEVATLHLHYEAGRHALVIERATELADESKNWPALEGVNLRSLEALARFATGDTERAAKDLDRLERELDEATPMRAAVLLNLANVARRRRGAEAAVPLLEEAVRIHEASRRPAAAAQVRTALGGALRDLGQVVMAEDVLERALEVRERLGDVRGAALTRGTLGLVAAERGHLRRALESLLAAERDLHGVAARRHGPLLRARAAEVRARLGHAVDARESEAILDPRELLYLGRAAHLVGDVETGRARLERGQELATRLGLAPVSEELRVASMLADAAATGSAVQFPTPTTADDAPPSVDAGAAAIDTWIAACIEGDGPLAPARSAAAAVFAQELVSVGRDDRAARLALALVRREPEHAPELLELARRAFERCAAGTTPREALSLRHNLLGVHDPRPRDLDRLDRSEEDLEPDEDMEILALLEINHRLVDQEDRTALLGEIVDQALIVTGAERGFLVLEVDGRFEFDTAIDSARGDVPRPQIEVSTSVVRAALERGAVVRVSNASEEPGLSAAPSVVQLDLRSVLCAPFEVDRNVRGAIYVDHRLHASAFGPRSERLLGLLADQAALAIRQQRRLAEINALNAQLQERVARQETDLETARRRLRDAGRPAPAGGLVGDSPALERVRATIERVASSELSVLVQGASGTGKELAARALHDLSERRRAAFVSENCASLPESLIESELFGYEKGAFTGAERSRPGLFERANGGTLFLDEIGEMPKELQSKLLRTLETREIRRLGDDRSRPIDVRLVTATNRDLEAEVRAGRFREDLYYRIAGMHVEMPRLDERIEDVPLLVHHFLAEQERKDGIRRIVAPGVLARLARRTWPGNVRELRNEVIRLCVLSGDDLVDPELVSTPGPTLAPSGASGEVGELATIAEIERRAILDTLERLGGDKRRAAQVLGISASKLYERLKRWREEDDERGDD
ncbi:Transcriptional regulatory protein ZraR [Planctomycetes bacterium Pla163]|uniref:Transcriptional regulatory protein ZraR n=1 Tax=Rohdeia mirabilis TaxID=2528008 RepID=A0A518CXD9_9BACT|nr:Transcriptional regulatory protein ZraR [Planctomycetes bacterium Pla163]